MPAPGPARPPFEGPAGSCGHGSALRAQPAQDCAERDPGPGRCGRTCRTGSPGRAASGVVRGLPAPMRGTRIAFSSGTHIGASPSCPGLTRNARGLPARRPRRGPSSTTRPVTCPGRGRQARTISDSCDSTLPCVPADPATPPRSDTGTRSPRRPDGDHATDATDPTPSASTGRSQPTARPTTLGHDPRRNHARHDRRELGGTP